VSGLGSAHSNTDANTRLRGQRLQQRGGLTWANLARKSCVHDGWAFFRECVAGLFDNDCFIFSVDGCHDSLQTKTQCGGIAALGEFDRFVDQCLSVGCEYSRSSVRLSWIPLGRPAGLPDIPFLYSIYCSFIDQINASGDFACVMGFYQPCS
jgi:hypothetical protein